MSIMVLLRYFFNLACFATAFGMTFWWLYRFSKNEDSVQIDVRPLNFEHGQYPILSFCLIDPFIESKLQKYNDTLNIAKYKEILLGISPYNGVVNINFDDVTIDFEDFYLGSAIFFRDGSHIQYLRTDAIHVLPHLTYSGLTYGMFIKCVGIDSKLTNIDFVYLMFNNSIYPKGIRPSSFYHPFSTVVLLHLPNQIALVENLGKYTWPKRKQKSSYSMDFTLQQIDVLKRRNKRNDPCIQDDLNFDQIILDKFLDKVGCKAPYHRTNKSLELCGVKNELKEASLYSLECKKTMKTCTSISSLTFTYDETDMDHTDELSGFTDDGFGSDFFRVALDYPNHYRETKMIQAIDFQTVIGNAGGYIGLFVGKMI